MRTLGKATILFVALLIVAGPVMAGTVAYWRFEGDLTDETGNHNGSWDYRQEQCDWYDPPHPNPVYRCACPEAAPVPLTGALNELALQIGPNFYDDNKYMSASGEDMSGGGVTVEGWFKFDVLDTGWVILAGQRYTAGDRPPFYVEVDPRRGLVFGMRADDTGGLVRIDSGFYPEEGVCYHFAAVYDPDAVDSLGDPGEQQKLYVDGVVVGWADNDYGFIGNDEDFIVGGKQYGGPCPYTYNDDVDIDEVRISNVALDPDTEFLNVPEPATMGLLAIGGVLGLLRRRR